MHLESSLGRNSCIQEVLGIECTTSLEDALDEVIPWIKEQVGPVLAWSSLAPDGPDVLF